MLASKKKQIYLITAICVILVVLYNYSNTISIQMAEQHIIYEHILSPGEFDSRMKEIESKYTAHTIFVHVIAIRHVKDIQKTWCPDTDNAFIAIDEAKKRLTKQIVIVEADVVKGEYKAKPEYLYRTHSILQIKAVPTLINWRHPNIRLVEGEEYASVDKLAEFLSN